MENLEIKITASNRNVTISNLQLANQLENLQGNLVFKFTDNFIDGVGRLEYRIRNKQYYVQLEKGEEEYYIPIKNVLTNDNGYLLMQLCITQLGNLVLTQDTHYLEGKEYYDSDRNLLTDYEIGDAIVGEVYELDIPLFKSNIFEMYVNSSINAVTVAPSGYSQWIDVANEKIAEMDNLNVEAVRETSSAVIKVTDKEGVTTNTVVYDGAKGDKGDKGDTGTTDYEEQENKPVLNGKTIVGNQTLEYYNIADLTTLNTKQASNDNNLQTDSKNITGAINELNTIAKQTNLAKGYTDYQTLITELNSGTIGKNLFNKDNVRFLYAYINKTTGQIVRSTNNVDKAITIQLEQNKTYTISFKQLNELGINVTNDDCNYCLTNSEANINDYGIDAGQITGGNYSFQITTNQEYYFLALKVSNNTKCDFEKTIETLQIEEGSVATDYEPFKLEPNYKIGQSFLIQTLNVPDLWVISIESTSQQYTYTTDEAFITATGQSGGVQVGYYKLGQLETLKQDLTNYVKNTDYATSSKAGIIKANDLYAFDVSSSNGDARVKVKTYQEYGSLDNRAFICKGTLENVLTGKGLVSSTTISDTSTNSTIPTSKSVYDYVSGLDGNNDLF